MTTAMLLVALCLQAPPNDTAAEEKSVREFLGTREAAFNREDAKWLVGHFTADGEHVNSSGKSAKGHAQLEKTYRELFEAPGHHQVKTIHTIDEIRCVTPDVATVIAGWKLSGLKDHQGKPLPDRSGGTIIILVKQEGEWRIDLLRADLEGAPRVRKARQVRDRMNLPTTHRLFGVEHEQFLLREDGAPPTHGDMDALCGSLEGRGYRAGARDSQGRILAALRATSFGNVVVTNDTCTHVLEVAFPPLEDLELFREMYRAELAQIDAVLGELGLVIHAGGAMDPPREVLWRPKANDPDGSRIRAILNRPVLDHPLFQPALPACIAATQVSLNVPAVDAIRRLHRYYEFEPLVPLLFGNSPEFNGVRGRCVRPLAWMANFPPTYCLLGVPDPIPSSLPEYNQMRLASQCRDYSFVAIRSADRLEFRSACSQNSIDDILLLIRFRLAVDQACERDVLPAGSNPRELFITTCTTGPGPWCRDLFAPLAEIDPLLQVLAPRLECESCPP